MSSRPVTIITSVTMRVIRLWSAASVAVAMATLVQAAMESAIPASSGIEVKDDLLASARVDPAMLLPNFPPAPRNLQADASTAALDHISSAMHVPMRLYHALQASLSSAQAPRPRSLGPSRAREVPTKRSVQGYGEHADHFKADELGQRQLVGGRVGVLYLAGGGRMVFTEQDTQESVAVDVQPGRFVSWPNDRYKHRLEADGTGNPRLMLGPMAVAPSSGMLEAVGDFEPECRSSYDCSDDNTIKCCGGICSEVEFDNDNCGACNRRCSQADEEDPYSLGSDCDGGRCTCMGAMCGTVCKDITVDPDNCGGCGRKCASDQWCNDGECKCPSDKCGDTCVDLQEDTANCGDCGLRCPAGVPCLAGICVCPNERPTLCGDRCVNLQTEKGHCSACGAACPGDMQCVSGSCVCPSVDQTNCGGGRCPNLQTSKGNCGACGTACPGDLQCSNGECACPSGLTDCNSKCVDTSSNKAFCGSCDKVCLPSELCVEGTCVCPTGTTNCNGACVNQQTSLAHCGTCGNACSAGQTCSSGKCTCTKTQCGETCTDTNTDTSNCGSCGESCQGDIPCIDGSCGKCMSGQYETKAAKCSNALSMTVVGPRTAVTRLPASIIVEFKVRNFSPTPVSDAAISLTFPSSVTVESTPVAAKSVMANSATSSNRVVLKLPAVSPGKKVTVFKTSITIVSAQTGRHAIATSIDFKRMSIKTPSARVNVKLPQSKAPKRK